LAKIINPKVAVLLPVFKGIKYLLPQVKSIISQKNINLTLYLSLDPSADGSIEMLNYLEKKYKNIVVIRHEKIFKSPTKHFFFLISKINENLYDFISLSDQDDIWFDKKLITSIKVLRQTNCDCYSSSVIAFDKKKSIKKKLFKSGNQKKFDYVFESAGPGSTYLLSKNFVASFKKFLIQKKDAYNFKNYDWLIYAFARNKKFKWKIDENPSLLYRQHSRNYLGARLGIKSNIYRIKEVISGRALKEVSKLLSLLDSKNKKNLPDIKNLPKLIKNSFNFRRNFLDKFLILIYFVSTFFFGKFNKNTYHFSFTKILNIFLVFCLIFLGHNVIFQYYDIIKKISYFDHFLNFIVFSIMMVLVSKRFYLLIFNEKKNKLKFINWFKIFINSQIFSIFLPYSSFFYRHYYLNKTIQISYETLFKYTVFIFTTEQFILWFLASCSLLIISSQSLLFFPPIIIMFLFYFHYIYYDKLVLVAFKVLKFFKFFKKYKFKLSLIQNHNKLKIFSLTLVKIFINTLLFYLVSNSLGFGFNLNQIMIMVFLNEILQNFKITPYNFGVAELSFGLLFEFFLEFDLISGALFKIHLRFIEVIFYFIIGLSLNFNGVKEKIYTITK